MKKVVMILLVVIFTTTSTLLSRSRTVTKEDSVNISSEIKSQLEVLSSEKILKVYNLSLQTAFCEVDNIEDLFENEKLILSEYYLIQNNKSEIRYKEYKNGQVIEASPLSSSERAVGIAFDNGFIKNLFQEEAYETYFLSGENCYTGTAIYYKTNQGDYVYYDHHTLGGRECLFPVKDFCNYQRTLRQSIVDPNKDQGNNEHGETLWDLSKYDIHSEEFFLKPDRNNAIIVFVVSFGILAAISAVFIFFSKKKKRGR